MSEFEAIITYCNEIFKDVAFSYNCVQYGFDDSFTMNRVEKEKKPRKKNDIVDDNESVADYDSIQALAKAADALK